MIAKKKKMMMGGMGEGGNGASFPLPEDIIVSIHNSFEEIFPDTVSQGKEDRRSFVRFFDVEDTLPPSLEETVKHIARMWHAPENCPAACHMGIYMRKAPMSIEPLESGKGLFRAIVNLRHAEVYRSESTGEGESKDFLLNSDSFIIIPIVSHKVVVKGNPHVHLPPGSGREMTIRPSKYMRYTLVIDFFIPEGETDEKTTSMLEGLSGSLDKMKMDPMARKRQKKRERKKKKAVEAKAKAAVEVAADLEESSDSEVEDAIRRMRGQK